MTLVAYLSRFLPKVTVEGKVFMVPELTLIKLTWAPWRVYPRLMWELAPGSKSVKQVVSVTFPP